MESHQLRAPLNFSLACLYLYQETFWKILELYQLMKLRVYPHLICNCHRLIQVSLNPVHLKTDGERPLDGGVIKSSSFGVKLDLGI